MGIFNWIKKKPKSLIIIGAVIATIAAVSKINKESPTEPKKAVEQQVMGLKSMQDYLINARNFIEKGMYDLAKKEILEAEKCLPAVSKDEKVQNEINSIRAQLQQLKEQIRKETNGEITF